jgi:hypothetical protein
MRPKRTWQPDEGYWELWVDADHDRYFPVFVGHVLKLDGDLVCFASGDWRLISEGFPFASKADAEQYIAQQGPPSRVAELREAASARPDGPAVADRAIDVRVSSIRIERVASDRFVAAPRPALLGSGRQRRRA